MLRFLKSIWIKFASQNFKEIKYKSSVLRKRVQSKKKSDLLTAYFYLVSCKSSEFTCRKKLMDSELNEHITPHHWQPTWNSQTREQNYDIYRFRNNWKKFIATIHFTIVIYVNCPNYHQITRNVESSIYRYEFHFWVL